MDVLQKITKSKNILILNEYHTNQWNDTLLGERTWINCIEEIATNYGCNSVTSYGMRYKADLYIVSASSLVKIRKYVNNLKQIRLLHFWCAENGVVIDKMNIPPQHIWTPYDYKKGNVFIGFYLPDISVSSFKPNMVVWGKNLDQIHNGKYLNLLNDVPWNLKFTLSDDAWADIRLKTTGVNCGILKRESFLNLLSTSSLLLSFGDPAGGPAGVEAIAAGCPVVIRKNQHFLLEELGEPYCYVYDDPSEITTILKKIKPIEPYIIPEFTKTAMEKRLHDELNNLDRC